MLKFFNNTNSVFTTIPQFSLRLGNLKEQEKVARDIQEGFHRNSQSRNSAIPRVIEEYTTQVSEEIEGRVTKKMSQEFSETERRILGALSKLDDFLQNPKVHVQFETVPGISRNREHERIKTGTDRGLFREWSLSWSRCLRFRPWGDILQPYFHTVKGLVGYIIKKQLHKSTDLAEEFLKFAKGVFQNCRHYLFEKCLKHIGEYFGKNWYWLCFEFFVQSRNLGIHHGKKFSHFQKRYYRLESISTIAEARVLGTFTIWKSASIFLPHNKRKQCRENTFPALRSLAISKEVRETFRVFKVSNRSKTSTLWSSQKPPTPADSIQVLCADCIFRTNCLVASSYTD